MKKVHFIVLGVLIGTLVACTTPRTLAPVVDRRPGVATATSSATPETPKVLERRGYYTVKKGDTLYRIALEFGKSYRDLVAWNKLKDASDIKVDQMLVMAPPDSGSAPASGGQIGNMTTESGVEVRFLSSAPSAVAANGGNKSAPRGDKRFYSDSALAELQKPDSGPSIEIPKTVDKTPVTPAVVQPAVAAAVATSGSAGDDEGWVDWMWPTAGNLLGTFDAGKKGIDIAGKPGQAVLAAAGGKVMYAGSGIRGYGNLLIIKHTSSLLSAYAHNKTILVKEGQPVGRGQKIAEMGNSDSDTVKLHFEIRQQGKPVDPSKFLPSR